jgi:ADP-heptose:LPS heptosyltransferase
MASYASLATSQKAHPLMNLAQLRSDCTHFSGYRPCHRGCECENCSDYDAAGPSILILKLYQLGNIVKTTPVLHALKKLYPNCRITWMASAAGCELLANNPLIDQLLTDNAHDLLYCQQLKWDLILSLEANRQGAAMATSLQAERKLGFGLNDQGRLWPLGPQSEPLYSFNLSNELRFHTNQKVVHELYFDLLEVPYEGEEYVINPSDQDHAYADHLMRSLGLADQTGGTVGLPAMSENMSSTGGMVGLPAMSENHRSMAGRPTMPPGRAPIIGLNTGGNAARFETKQWTIDGFVQLARLLHQRLGAKVVLLGGPAEVARNSEILSRTRGYAVDSGCDHTILQFCAFLSKLDCVVSGDSFGLQAAVAMKTPVVGIFGPTPPQEIAIFGRGTKVTTDLDCSPCYIRSATACRRGADCMERITPEEVYAATAAVLGR